MTAVPAHSRIERPAWVIVLVTSLAVGPACGRVSFAPVTVGLDTGIEDADAGRDADADADADAARADTGDTGPIDAGPAIVTLEAAVSFAIAPTMFAEFAVEDIATTGDRFCACGGFAGTVDVGTDTLMADGGDDAWMACFWPSLEPIWARGAGGGGSDLCTAASVHPAGGLLFSGIGEGAFDFGAGAERRFGSDDWFVVEYAPDGSLVDAEVYGSSGDDDFGRGVSARADGRLLLSGGCFDGTDFGGGPLSGVGNREVCLAILDGTDTHVASYMWSGPGNDRARGALELPDGRIVVVGQLEMSLDLGDQVHTSMGGADAFVMVLRNDGVVERSWTVSGPDDQFVNGIAFDASGNLYLSGTTVGDVDFGDGMRTVPRVDGFVVSFTPAGMLRWAHLIGGTAAGVSEGGTLAFDSAGVLYTAGGVYEGGTVAGQPFVSMGGKDYYVLALARDGTIRWIRTFGSSMDDEAEAVGVLSDGAIVVGGYFSASANVEGVAIEVPVGGGAVFARLRADLAGGR